MKDGTFFALRSSCPDPRRTYAPRESTHLSQCSLSDLPAGEVLVRVAYSSLNYKDALAMTGNRGVSKNYPHTPGIDAAGTVERSSVSELRVGQKVIVHGYDLGMGTWGGLGEYIRVPARWAIPLPDSLDAREAMCYGTAGFTAFLAVTRLVEALPPHPSTGRIVVSGSGGAVGSAAVAFLARHGYEVVASTGGHADPVRKALLHDLGAAQVVSREEVSGSPDNPLFHARWDGGIDTTGGRILAGILAATNYGGAVSACGLTGGTALPTTVLPFILRAVRLIGIDSVQLPIDARREVWRNMSEAMRIPRWEELAVEVPLEDVPRYADELLHEGRTRRVVVRVGDSTARG